jgi:hypothetical protein
MLSHDIKEMLRLLPEQNQRQDSLTDQLKDLIVVANRLGMYDAADFIAQKTQKRLPDPRYIYSEKLLRLEIFNLLEVNNASEKGLRTRLLNAFECEGIDVVDDLLKYSGTKVLSLPRIKKKCFEYLQKSLLKHGITFI